MHVKSLHDIGKSGLLIKTFLSVVFFFLFLLAFV